MEHGARSRERGARSRERQYLSQYSAICGISGDPMNGKQFRFQDLKIWTHAAEFSPALFALADQLEQRHLFRFADQLRGATLSITNNIAEGSGSLSDIDFANFLNTARRSTFEVANILTLLGTNNYLDEITSSAILPQLEQQSKMLLAFIRTLRDSDAAN
jgi:four helix bundle protein